MKPARTRGYTLIELLVALAILGVIVVLCGRIFQQANVSWNTGSRKAEINMIGRGIAEFIAQDISRCVPSTPAAVLTGNSPSFTVIDDASWPSLLVISYSLSGPLTRTVGAPAVLLPDLDKKPMYLKVSATVKAGAGFVDVTVTVTDTDPLITSYSVDFKSRAWLANRDRYKYEE